MGRGLLGRLGLIGAGPVCCQKKFYEYSHVVSKLEPVCEALQDKHPDEPEVKNAKALGMVVWSFRQYMEDTLGRSVPGQPPCP